MESDGDEVYEKSKGLYHALSYSSLGLEMAISIFVGFGAGWWLDDRYGTDPWLMLLGLAFGITAGFRALWRAGQRMRQDAASANDETNGQTGASQRREG